MMDVKAITDMLETYVRPATFPVGLKMLKPGEAFPPRTRTPADLGSHFATCQTINVVRRYGWSIGLAAEHHSCPLGLVALGFKPNVPLPRASASRYELRVSSAEPRAPSAEKHQCVMVSSEMAGSTSASAVVAAAARTGNGPARAIFSTSSMFSTM